MSRVASRYNLPEYPINPAKYKKRKVGICDNPLQQDQTTRITHEYFFGVAVFQGISWISDQVRQPIASAEEAVLGVELKSLGGFIDLCLQGQGWSAVRLVLVPQSVG